MKITSLTITRREKSGTKMLATISIVLDEMIVIHDIKIIKKDEGFILAMPSHQIKMNTYKDIVHPIKQEVRQSLERIVFETYNQAVVKNHSKMVLQFSATDDVDLTNQTYSMFEIIDATSGGSKPQLFENLVPDKKKVANPNSSDDDELLKWLES